MAGTNDLLTSFQQGVTAVNNLNTTLKNALPISVNIPSTAYTSFANPTAKVGLAAVNGAATTAMRSDAAPPIDQTISPNWTGTHAFQSGGNYAYQFNGWGYIAPGVNGVVGNGVTDDTAAIQTILNAYNNILWDAGKYLISSTLTITVGNPPRNIRGTGATRALSPSVENGTLIIASSTFTGSTAILISSAAGNAAMFAIGGFAIMNQTAGSGANYGLRLSAPGGNNKNLIDDVFCGGFAFNFIQFGSRSVIYHRCTAWDADLSGTETTSEFGWYFYGDSTHFCGDSDLLYCQTRSSNSGTGIGITDQGNAGTVLAGFGFNCHTHYYGSIGLSVSATGAGSTIGDIWVTPRSQFEGIGSGAAIMMDVVASSSGSGAVVEDIHIEGIYGSGGGWGKFLNVVPTSGGSVNSIFLVNNFLATPLGTSPINIDGSASGALVRDVTIANNQIWGPGAAGGAATIINVNDVFCSTVNGNSLTGTGAAAGTFIAFSGAASNFIVAVGNNSGSLAGTVVSNTTGAASTAIANNI